MEYFLSGLKLGVFWGFAILLLVWNYHAEAEMRLVSAFALAVFSGVEGRSSLTRTNT